MKLSILAWQEQAKPLPLLHRCAILYLTAPVLIWLVGWFEWWFGVPAALLVGLALAPALRGGWRPHRPSPASLGIVALGFACAMLTAHGGFFDGNNWDWWDRRALLLDLSHHPWPVYVRDGLADYLPWGGGEREALLRYYLGWYMVPGLAGRLFGPAALNWAVPLWSGAGLALVLLLFVRGLDGRRAVLGAGIFLLFGSMDPLRSLLMHGAESFHFGIDRLGWPGVDVDYEQHFGFRGRVTLYQPHFESFRYSTDIIAAAMYALLIAHLRRHPRFVAASGVVLAAALLWSPWVAVGLLPFVAVLLWGNLTRACALPATEAHRPAALASWSNLLLAVPLAALFAVYLSCGSMDFGHGWLWETDPRRARHHGDHGALNWRDVLMWAWKFYLFEFLALLLFLLLLRPRLMRNPLFVAMLATLLLLPWYRFAGFNLLTRGILPATVLLSWFCVRALLATEAGFGERGAFSRRRACSSWFCVRALLATEAGFGERVRHALRRFGAAGVICCLGVGAVRPLLQLAEVTRDDVAFRYALSGFTNGAAEGKPIENLAVETPPLLAALLRNPVVDTPSAASEPAFRADFDIHVRDRRLVLVKETCGRDERGLHVRLPQPGTNARHDWNAGLRWLGAGCGTVVGLPGWRIDRAWVGRGHEGWAVEILLDEAGEAVGVSHPPSCAFRGGESGRRCPANPGMAVLRKAYARARAGPPAAQSRFDVYVDDEWLTHVREPCAFDDMEAKFFLHLVPADPANLPPSRKSTGFDNRDFAFGDRGGLIDGKCVAVSRLPYPVREVRTGQFSAAGPIWSVTARPAQR